MKRAACILAAILLFTGCSKKEDVETVINNELNDLLVLVEIAEYFYATPSIDPSVIEKLDTLIYWKIINARSLKPKIMELNGTSIKGLCAVVSISRNMKFGKSLNDPQLHEEAMSYLAGITPDVKEHADRLKMTIFSESDCAI